LTTPAADGLYLLRLCESSDNYGSISAGGAYRGAYQFGRGTWDAVASRWYPELVGADPAAVSPEGQDALARALYAEAGSSPWPHCGRYL
jgi:muramidase (phage lysozyme)